MSVISKFLFVCGSVLFLHSAYSAHLNHINLPLDLKIEVMIGLSLFVASSILAIQNQAYLNIKNELVEPEFKWLKNIYMRQYKEFNKLGIEMFNDEYKVGFIDIREKRKQYLSSL